MNLLGSIKAFLQRIFGSRPQANYVFVRKPMGPVYEWLNEKTIRITEGELQGWEFGMTMDITDDEAHVHLSRAGAEIGHCDLQRHGFEATIVLWNIVVKDELRHKGLASIMAAHAFRKLLELEKSASCSIRMLRLIKPSDKITKIQNVGIGVISRKLGFSPEYDLNSLLKQKNIQMVELIGTDGVMPPGYRIVLSVYPLVLIAFLVDPETGKPYPSGHRIYNSLVTPESAESWVGEQKIIIGNGNYVLRREGIEELINHLATNDVEAGIYAQRLKPVAK